MHAERLRVAHLQDTSGGPHPWPGLDQRRWIPTAPAVDAGTASDHPGYQQFSAVTGRQVFPAGDGQVLYPPIAVRHQVSFMGVTWSWSPRERMLIIGQSFPRVAPHNRPNVTSAACHHPRGPAGQRSAGAGDRIQASSLGIPASRRGQLESADRGGAALVAY